MSGNRDDVHDVIFSHRRGLTSPTIGCEMLRRNGNGPVIVHLRDGGHLERNHLKGKAKRERQNMSRIIWDCARRSRPKAKCDKLLSGVSFGFGL